MLAVLWKVNRPRTDVCERLPDDPTIPRSHDATGILPCYQEAIISVVEAVSRGRSHSFSKRTELWITLVAGHGVEGDAHAGVTVKHRSRVAKDPSQPNLRQVHLMHAELFEELRDQGFRVAAGDLGENITTRGLDILSLPRGTRLRIGDTAVVELTGLRNPCVQIDRFQKGLLSAMIARDNHGRVVRKSGVMGIVLHGGDVRPGDAIVVELPAQPRVELDVV
jgi:MOSC domain-containing protein YiiM